MALSDLLLYGITASSPAAVAEAASDALVSDVISGARSIGVFWEVYGLGTAGEPVDYVLTVEPVNVDWLHRAAAGLHLTDPASSLRIQWQEVPQQVNGIATRAARVDLSQLRGGKYRMEVRVVAKDGSDVLSSREMLVK